MENHTLYAGLALLPILVAAILLVGFRMSAKLAMPVVYILTAIIALFFWQMSGTQVLAATIQGLFITFDILFIIFAAILLLNTLKHSGAVTAIREGFSNITPDRRVQLIIVCWLFGSFIEGASGFGTPAAIVAPLLVALGFPAMAAVMLGMMVQSTAVTFGAVGTPILVGVRGGLESAELLSELNQSGLDFEGFIQIVTTKVVSFHAIVGTLMPLLMIMMLTRFFGNQRSWTEGLSILPFAIFGGLAFTVPYFLTGYFLGPEFPSLLGAMIGLAIVIFAVKKQFLLPDDHWDFPDQTTWPGEWRGKMIETKLKTVDNMTVLKAWLPYLLLVVLLIITRLPELGIGAALKSVSLQWPDILNTSIAAKTTPLYLPAAMLFLVSLITIFLHRMSLKEYHLAFKESSITLVSAGFVLVFTVPMVRIYINSGFNASELASMPIVLAEWVSVHVGQIWPMFAPAIGALGAFIAGSNTVSNLMFAQFQYSLAESLTLSGTTIVALQAVGAAAGNMIAIHNVVAASATVGLLGQEGATLRRTILPTIYYLTAVGVLGLIACNII